jgi:hypothetical protein
MCIRRGGNCEARFSGLRVFSFDDSDLLSDHKYVHMLMADGRA